MRACCPGKWKGIRMHKHSPCLKAWNGELGFEPADKKLKASLNAGSLAFKGGSSQIQKMLENSEVEKTPLKDFEQ